MTRKEAKFRTFHRNNPQGYALFCRYAREAIQAGMERYSAQRIVERIRWQSTVIRRGKRRFKISNDTCAYYARMFRRDYPPLGNPPMQKPAASPPSNEPPFNDEPPF